MAITVYKKTALTGGGGGSLDAVDGAGLLDGDFAFVTVSGVLYTYILDDDADGAESSPTKITPDTNAGTKRWILQTTYERSTITASDAELNVMTGVTSSTAELNLLDGATAGTAVASKALCLGANKNVNTLVIAPSGLKIGAGAGTAVTCTAAELNKLDGLATTAAELGYVAGVTSAIQTQLGTKAPLASPTFTGYVTLPTQTLTATGAITSNIVVLNHSSVKIEATLANPTVGQVMIIAQADTGTVGHTVTLDTATWNGTNKIATFNAQGEALYVVAVSTTRFVVIENIGSVAFSG